MYKYMAEIGDQVSSQAWRGIGLQVEMPDCSRSAAGVCAGPDAIWPLSTTVHTKLEAVNSRATLGMHQSLSLVARWDVAAAVAS